MPADKLMEFGIDALSSAVYFSMRARVSAIVVEEWIVRSLTRASMAAMGIVSSGSDLSRSLYVSTML